MLGCALEMPYLIEVPHFTKHEVSSGTEFPVYVHKSGMGLSGSAFGGLSHRIVRHRPDMHA